ncbi:zinc knuckle-domain-containing protein [Xylariaceae sp. AK1471]|nr:zinc knuckle-domain-containing protein [Xylariaceae sp. AK1471]
MYRRGPSKSTPTNVQCQKCLKRGHYSYECKASAQERPYVPRPSRTQQLVNPKLVPKLTSDTTDALQKTKKGLADEQLAKREAERARKQELEQDEDTDNDVPKRKRSDSYDSVSTISTKGPSSPPHGRVSLSSPRPSRAVRSPSPIRDPSKRRSFDSVSDYERRYSSSPERRSRNRISPNPPRRQTRSPSRDDSPQRGRFDYEEQAVNHGPGNRRRGRYSQSPSRSPPPPENRRQFRSRSPQGARRPGSSPSRYNDRRPAEAHRRNDDEKGRRPQRRDARERSLSPFSKRLALTQAMNTGR